MDELLEKFRSMDYDHLANLGIRLEKTIDRGRFCGARCEEEKRKLALVDQVMKEKERG